MNPNVEIAPRIVREASAESRRGLAEEHNALPGDKADVHGLFFHGFSESDDRAAASWGRGLPARKDAGDVKKGCLLGDLCNTPIRTKQRLTDTSS